MVKLIGDPTPQTAKVISFTWLELQEARPQAQRVVVLNDLRARDPLAEETEEEFRKVSEQTIAILSAYRRNLTAGASARHHNSRIFGVLTELPNRPQ